MMSNDPPPLYKYLSLAPSQTPSWQERLLMLLSGRCYLSSAADFNDPFDCLPYIEVPAAGAALDGWRQGMAQRIAGAMAGKVPAWFIQAQAQEALDALPVALLRDKLQQAAAANAEQLGVFCLAETIESVLMWSHYATNHHGIALQFDFARGRAENLLPIWKVDYQPVRPVIADMHVAAQERPLADALAVKADFWRHEQEWLVMKADMARTVVQFDRTIITGIALGAKCTAEHETAIRGMMGDAEIDLYRMCVDRRTFDLTMIAATTVRRTALSGWRAGLRTGPAYAAAAARQASLHADPRIHRRSAHHRKLALGQIVEQLPILEHRGVEEMGPDVGGAQFM